MATSKTKKDIEFVPEFTIVITDTTTVADVYKQIINCKLNKMFTASELAIINVCLDDLMLDKAIRLSSLMLDEASKIANEIKLMYIPKKKPSLLKRVWNWITRKSN